MKVESKLRGGKSKGGGREREREKEMKVMKVMFSRGCQPFFSLSLSSFFQRRNY
jgi:hypothetical protein